MESMLLKKQKISKRMIEKYIYEAFEDLETTFWEDLDRHFTDVLDKYS